MSLFPAYATPNDDALASTTKEDTKTNVPDAWLNNPSFQEIELPTPLDQNEATIPSTTSETADTSTSKIDRKRKHKKEKKKHKKKERREKSKEKIIEQLHQFTGNEDYYVDKQPCRGYVNVDTLHKPACPRYKVQLPHLGRFRHWKWTPSKRYFEKVKRRDETALDKIKPTDELFTMQTKAIKEVLTQHPKDIDQWFKYVNHQNSFPMSATKIQITERKLDVLKQALLANHGNDMLYCEYVRIIEETYPSYEVSKILEGLISKDPTNYVLWNAQIYATQGSMARCNVPDVLKLYSKCMNTMYKRNRSDGTMIKLYKRCGLFLRQCGLYEQFFALLKLALDLNIAENKFNKIQPNESEQHTLIEYEEMILKSGLPMNEIWLRIEKLRQNFYFLPCPSDRTCSDPQRIIFNEDIFHYVYPLSNREYSFHLAIVILYLLKVPLSGYHGQDGGLPDIAITKELGYSAEFDSIEELLAVLIKPTINGTSQVYDLILSELLRDFSIGPSYLPTQIGHELYLNCVNEILLLCSEAFEGYTCKSRRNIFLLLWIRLERIVLIVNKLLSKWSDEKEKRMRTKIKNLLKRDENRNCLMLYNEYALIEYECGRFDVMDNIFLAAIDNSSQEDDKTAWWAINVSFAETLIRNGRWSKALNCLIALVMGEKFSDQLIATQDDTPSNSTALLALKKLNDCLANLIAVERNVAIMEIEQYFLPDYLINVIKSKIYFLLLWKDSKENAIEQIEFLLKTFIEKDPRHLFIRENLYELFVNVITHIIDGKNPVAKSKHPTLLSGIYVFEVLHQALNEFPNNLFITKAMVMVESQPWHKIRTIITQKLASKAIVLLVAGAIYRSKRYTCDLQSDNAHSNFISYTMPSDINEIETIYKLRVCNMLRNITSNDSLMRKNSLIWRIYMKFLIEFREDFNKSKNILLAALDECPWNKALYLEGTVFVPQEVAHIQDLIIEKQLRIYALPEELEILRNYDPNALT